MARALRAARRGDLVDVGFDFCWEGVRTDMAGHVDGDFEDAGFSASLDSEGGEITLYDPASELGMDGGGRPRRDDRPLSGS